MAAAQAASASSPHPDADKSNARRLSRPFLSTPRSRSWTSATTCHGRNSSNPKYPLSRAVPGLPDSLASRTAIPSGSATPVATTSKPGWPVTTAAPSSAKSITRQPLRVRRPRGLPAEGLPSSGQASPSQSRPRSNAGSAPRVNEPAPVTRMRPSADSTSSAARSIRSPGRRRPMARSTPATGRPRPDRRPRASMARSDPLASMLPASGPSGGSAIQGDRSTPSLETLASKRSCEPTSKSVTAASATAGAARWPVSSSRSRSPRACSLPEAAGCIASVQSRSATMRSGSRATSCRLPSTVPSSAARRRRSSSMRECVRRPPSSTSRAVSSVPCGSDNSTNPTRVSSRLSDSQRGRNLGGWPEGGSVAGPTSSLIRATSRRVTATRPASSAAGRYSSDRPSATTRMRPAASRNASSSSGPASRPRAPSIRTSTASSDSSAATTRSSPAWVKPSHAARPMTTTSTDVATRIKIATMRRQVVTGLA